MSSNITAAIEYCWEAIGFVWLIGLAFTRRTMRGQRTAARLFNTLLIVAGFFLLANVRNVFGWLDARIFPLTEAAGIAGLILTAAGCLFAIWARITLGGNWSGLPTVKVGHELVVRGPYALARHPIYTGLLLAAVGTGIATGEVRCVLGVALIPGVF